MKKVIEENRDNPYIVPALARGLRLLETMAARPEGCSMTELSSSGIPFATLFRMLTTFTEYGYIRRLSDGRYQVTGKLYQLASSALGSTSLVSLAEGPMRKLRDLCRETVLLAILHGDEGVILHQEISSYPVKVVLETGHHFPLHSAAPAKAILAFLPEHELEELTGKIDFVRFTDRTICTREDFLKELEVVRRTGAAFDRGEEDAELRCVSVPVFDTRGRVAAALWISGPCSRLTDEKMQSLIPLLKEAADSVFINK